MSMYHNTMMKPPSIHSAVSKAVRHFCDVPERDRSLAVTVISRFL